MPLRDSKQLQMIKNIIYTIFAISLCLGLGRLINGTLGGMPASLYGMIIYCLLLQMNWLSPIRVSQTNQWAIKHMGVCFVPAAVGVIDHFELIKSHGLAIVGIIFFTTFMLLTLVAVLAEKYFRVPTNTSAGKPSASAVNS